MNTNHKRLLYLDYAKGFGILCLLFVHTMNTDEHYVGMWITSWFMPIFFVVRGIILQKKYKATVTLSDVLQMFKKRFFQLGVPYLVFCIILTFFYYALSLASHTPFDWMYYTVRIVTFKGIDSLWFIPCYFLTEVLMVLTLMIPGKLGIVVRTLIALTGAVCIFFGLRFPLSLEIECFLFVYCGYIVSKIDLIKKCPVILSMLLFASGIPLAVINGAVDLSDGKFNYGWLYILCAFITSISIVSLFCFFDQKAVKFRFLQFFGQDTIVVLCTNNLLIETIRLFDAKITGNYLLNSGLWGSIVFTAYLIILEYGIIHLSKLRIISILFGKHSAVETKT